MYEHIQDVAVSCHVKHSTQNIDVNQSKQNIDVNHNTQNRDVNCSAQLTDTCYNDWILWDNTMDLLSLSLQITQTKPIVKG